MMREGATKAAVSTHCSENSKHPVNSCLGILAGSREEGGDGDYYRAMGYETMHIEDLGTTPDLVTGLMGWIKVKYNRQQTKIHNGLNE